MTNEMKLVNLLIDRIISRIQLLKQSTIIPEDYNFPKEQRLEIKEKETLEINSYNYAIDTVLAKLKELKYE